jgi:anti-anti-sigma factor
MTSQSKHEQLLREAERLAPVGAWTVDVESGEVTWSEEMYAICGFAPGTPVTYDSLLNAIHPEDRGKFEEAVLGALESGEGYAADGRVVRPDGSVRWVHTKGEVLMREGAVVRIHGTAQDITERKDLERAALAMEERARLREIFEQFPAIIGLFRGPDHVIEFGNPIWHRYLGERAEIGRPLVEAIPEVATLGILDILDSVYRTGRTTSVNEQPMWIDYDGDGVPEQRYGSFVWKPLRSSDGEIDGVLTYGIDVTDLVLARKAAERHAEAERTIAEALQRSLLPRAIPAIPEVSISARYLPGAEGVEVGGDWYDIFEAGERVGVCIGDVVGRGIRAAATMGQLRTALRAYASDEMTPEATINRLSRFVHEIHLEGFATLVYGLFDPEAGTFTFVRAGHPPPLIVDPNGNARVLAAGLSPPLTESHRFESVSVPLGEGETLILYTDGLIERPHRSLDEGLAALMRAAERATGNVEEVCDAILEALDASSSDDDIALVALRVEPVTATLSLTLPADPSSLSVSRRVLRRWLQSIGATSDDTHDVVLAIGEACANVIEHAYGPDGGDLVVSGSFDGAAAEVTVRDHGRWRSPRGAGRGRGSKIMSTLGDSVDVNHNDEGTEIVFRRTLGVRPSHHQMPADQDPSRRARPEPAVSTTALEGDIDLSSSALTAQSLLDAVDNQALGLVVDVSNVNYLDSSGLSMLVGVAERLRRRGQGFRLVYPSDGPVARLMELTALERSLGHSDDVAEAVSEIRRSVGDSPPGHPEG